MPTITRWFNVSHDINADPEMWELREAFGDRAGFVWLECLSIADRNSSVVGPASDHTRNQLASKCRTSRAKVESVLGWCRVKGWLTFDQDIRVAKWSKYNKTRDTKKLPSYPNPPNPPNQPLRIISAAIEKKHSIATAFPDDWKWLLDFIKSQSEVIPPDSFLDFRWWDSVSYACGGLDQSFLTIEYNKMRRWLLENPRRRPTAKGWRRFVAGWLERAHDKERRFPNATKTR